MGLMIELEIVSDRKTREPAPEIVADIFVRTKKKGLLIGKGGMFNVIRITPPLTASTQEIGNALQVLEDTFTEIEV